MKPSTMLLVLLVMAVAGLCLGEAVQQAAPGARTPFQTQPKASTAQAPLKTKGDMIPYSLQDGLQCIMGHSDALAAAYTEVAAAGCKKVKSGQWSEYYCGEYASAEYQKCEAARKKIQAILDGCRLKPPQHTPAPEDGLGLPNDVPGCNSLGFQCTTDPAVPR